MRSANKSRNRSKNGNRRGSATNNINRVFDSAGPEGKVRGTPQQIIEKYMSLTHDSMLSGDRVAAENFQQHAEHYSRMLIDAQREISDKQNENNSEYSGSLKQKSKSDDCNNIKEDSLVKDNSEKDKNKTNQVNVLEFENNPEKSVMKS